MIVGSERPTPYGCDVFPERDRVRIAPRGELDLATTPQLDKTVHAFFETGPGHVVLDLRGLEFIESTGLTLILRFHELARRSSIRFGLIAGPPEVQRIFELTGVIAVLNFEPDSDVTSTSNGRHRTTLEIGSQPATLGSSRARAACGVSR